MMSLKIPPFFFILILVGFLAGYILFSLYPKKKKKGLFNRKQFMKAYVGCSYDIKRTAESLNVSTRTIYRWINKYDIERHKPKKKENANKC
jgi:DNA invertase Pin-like site-specific DNA recombinase